MLSQLLIQAGDNNAAISTLTKSLAISVQLYGLDSMETFSTHLNLAAVLQQLGNHSAALSHYLAAKYIIWLIGGPHHPEFANMYFRIATIFADLEHHDVALRCYLEAKKLINICGDQAMHAFICQSIGDTYALLRNFKESIAAYKQSYLINRQLFGETDSRTVESKSKCELVIRTSAEQSEIAAKERLDRENEEKARKTSMWLDDDTVGKSSGKKGSNAKNKKGKKK
jgi:tetratricopeptide (TPR) repeat protein